MYTYTLVYKEGEGMKTVPDMIIRCQSIQKQFKETIFERSMEPSEARTAREQVWLTFGPIASLGACSTSLAPSKIPPTRF